MSLREQDFFTLSVHYFPKATEAGVHPVNVPHASFLSALAKDHPEWYCVHEFRFTNPPTREEFLQVVDHRNWTDLLPVIARHPWPMLDYMHRSVNQYLYNDNKIVGRLEIDRDTIYQNVGIERLIAVTVNMVDDIVRRLSQEHRVTARNWIYSNQNVILEKANGLIKSNHTAGDLDVLVVYVINTFMYEKGFRKSKPKLTPPSLV